MTSKHVKLTREFLDAVERALGTDKKEFVENLRSEWHTLGLAGTSEADKTRILKRAKDVIGAHEDLMNMFIGVFGADAQNCPALYESDTDSDEIKVLNYVKGLPANSSDARFNRIAILANEVKNTLEEILKGVEQLPSIGAARRSKAECLEEQLKAIIAEYKDLMRM